MTVQQLQYVLEVNKAGSITRAAKNLFVTPSSVSAAITSLEKELGYLIFERSWQGVQLTTIGKQVVNHASYICERLQQIEKGAVEAGRKGFCVLSGSYTPFSNAFSRLTQEFVQGSSARFSQKLLDNRFEAMDEVAANNADLMVMCALDSSLTRFEPSAHKRKLEWELRKVLPAVVIIGPGHRLYHEEEICLDQLGEDAIIDSTSMAVMDVGIFKHYIPINPYHSILVDDRTQRYELVRNGAGYQICAKLTEKINRQYGFRCITIPGVFFHVISVINPAIPVREETRRYLELLDEELSDISDI